jgi:hypothetical protein
VPSVRKPLIVLKHDNSMGETSQIILMFIMHKCQSRTNIKVIEEANTEEKEVSIKEEDNSEVDNTVDMVEEDLIEPTDLYT